MLWHMILSCGYYTLFTIIIQYIYFYLLGIFYSCFNIYWNNVTTLKWNSTSIYLFTLKHSFMITKLVFVDQLYIFKKNFMEWYLWNIFNVAFTVITCASTPCQHGACTDSPKGFVCACNSSYTGIRCDTGK